MSREAQVSPKNLAMHELIGLSVRVLESTDQGLVGISGEVVDETKKTLSILVKGGAVKVPKEICLFHFTLPDGTKVEVEGARIVGRPERRLGRRRRRW